MGLFDDNSDDSQQNSAMNLYNQRVTQEEAELNQKKQELTEQRLAIIKSQGQPDFTPHPITPSIFGTPNS